MSSIGVPETKGRRMDQAAAAADGLDECDLAELHKIGSIQAGAGNLFFVDTAHGTIVAHDEEILSLRLLRRYASSNPNSTETVNPSAGANLLGERLSDWIPKDLYEALNEVMRTTIFAKKAPQPRAFHFYQQGSVAYAISIATSNPRQAIVSIEIETVDTKESAAQLSTTLHFLSQIVDSFDHETIAELACDALFKLLGVYDRGMVYKFHDDLSGEVMHEVKSDHLQSSYLGLRYPKSDIPASARALYSKNGLRFVLNCHGRDVAVVSGSGGRSGMGSGGEAARRNDSGGGDGDSGAQGPPLLDMTQVRMRGVHISHLRYMQNMGMTCSLSLALMVEGKLWGLLAFHGYKESFRPSLHHRIALETIGAMVSVRMEGHIKKAQSTRVVKLTEVLLSLKPEKSVIHNLYDMGEDLLKICDAEVIVAYIMDPREGEADRLVIGDNALVPLDAFWTRMAKLPNRDLCVVSTRQQILEKLAVSQEDCPANGFIFFREGRTGLFLGRGMRCSNVKWAGNPDEPKIREGDYLSPRNSFEAYLEGARLEARAWSEQDIHVISVLRDRFCEHTHKYMLDVMQNDIEETNRKYLDAIARASDNFEFFAHMSHELRTPFHGVMGCLQVLQDSIDDLSKTDAMDIVNAAISSGNHMINLLNDILDLSKKKHLSHVIAKDKVIYQSMAFEAIECMKSLASSRHIEIKTSVKPSLQEDKVVITTDRTKFIQIVSNLVNNAIKFTPAGSITIDFQLVGTLDKAVGLWKKHAADYAGCIFTMKEGEMTTENEEVDKFAAKRGLVQGHQWLVVSVADTGTGIKPDELVKVFAPYVQSSTGSNRTYQGTGLGLYICVLLCRQMGGFLACASTPGEGTVFHAGFPVEEEVMEDIATAETPLSVGDDIPFRNGVLIVDDIKVNIKILLRTLQLELSRAGIKDMPIWTAHGGAEAVELYKTHKPSLCIIDYHMPDVDGAMATKLIREHEKSSGTAASYILSYTADVNDRTTAYIMSQGADEIMVKPPPKGSIKQLVQRLTLTCDDATENLTEHTDSASETEQ